MSQQFTKGPWKCTEDGKLPLMVTAKEPNLKLGAVEVCRLTTELSPISFQESYANARLISAAPEMYEALQKAVERLEASQPPKGLRTDQVVQSARRALSKARGEG